MFLSRFMGSQGGGRRTPDESGAKLTEAGLPLGFSLKQGYRPYMEDVYVAHKFQDPKEPSNSVCFFGVFDGHSGRRACEYARDNLPREVQAELSRSEPEEALRRAFLRTDEEFLKIAHKEGLGDGSTAITALVRGRTLWVANAGDARAILVSGSTAIAMSEDHKPNRESERRRIMQAGGSVVFMGCWRVNGVLATSRGFGDRELKKVVSAEPEIRHRTLMEGDDYLVLASDGIWDVLSNQVVADIVARSSGCRNAASAVTEEALRRGSMDNVTAVVISLRSIWGGQEMPSNLPPPPRAGDTPRSSLGSASFGEIPTAQATSPLAGRRAVNEAADSWSNKAAHPLRASADILRHSALPSSDLAIVGVGRSGTSAARLSLEAPGFRSVMMKRVMSAPVGASRASQQQPGHSSSGAGSIGTAAFHPRSPNVALDPFQPGGSARGGSSASSSIYGKVPGSAQGLRDRSGPGGGAGRGR